MQVEHGRVSDLADRGPCLGTPAALIVVVVVSSMVIVVAAAPTPIISVKTVLARGRRDGEVKIQQFICVAVVLLLDSSGCGRPQLLTMLAIPRITTHLEV